MTERKPRGRFAAEFAVIVIGVLTALALESAREGWLDSRAERQYLLDLRDEAALNLERINAYVAESDSLTVELDSAIARIQSGRTAGREESILNTLLRASWQSGILTGGVSSAVFDDLTNTGNLRLISNVGVRLAAANTYAVVQSTSVRVIQANQRVESGMLRLLAGHHFPSDVDIIGAGAYMDFDSVVAEVGFSREVNREHHRIRYFNAYLRQLQPVFDDLVSTLDEELGRSGGRSGEGE